MGEFYSAIEWYKAFNTKYNEKFALLIEKENRCLSEINIKSNESQKICMADKEEFENYLKKYTEVFAEKGKIICSKYLEEKNEELKNLTLTQLQDYSSKCISLYISDFNEFENNVLRKLDSLVNKYSIKNL